MTPTSIHRPSAAPSPQRPSCDFGSVQIIRLGDPVDNQNGTIFELYFYDTNCRNVEITEPMSLVFFSRLSSSTTRKSKFVNLKGKKTNKNGVISICKSNSPHTKSDCIELPEGEHPDAGEPVCICSGPPSSCYIVDKFGYGECLESRRSLRQLQQIGIDYSTGQAQRIRLNNPDERGIFIEENWRITTNVT